MYLLEKEKKSLEGDVGVAQPTASNWDESRPKKLGKARTTKRGLVPLGRRRGGGGCLWKGSPKKG